MSSDKPLKKSTRKINGHIPIENGVRSLSDGCVMCQNGSNEFIVSHRRHAAAASSSHTEAVSSDGDHDDLSKYITQNKSPPGSVFHFYSRFGCYWNFFPKTDYTYLPSSPYYDKEISPGIPVIPNLSRHPIRRKTRSSANESRDNSAYLADTSAYLASSDHESSLCDQHSQANHQKGRSAHGVASLVQSTLDVVKTAVTTTITRTTTIVTSVTENIVTTVTDTVSPPPTASLVRRVFGFLALLLLFLLLLLLLLFLLGKGDVFNLKGPLLAATQSGTGAIETRLDKNSDVSFILSTFDTIRRRLDYLEQKVDSHLQDRSEYDHVKDKINTIETNLAQLKTDVQETEKSIAESKSSQNYDLTMKGQVDMNLVTQVVDTAIKKYHADFVSKPDFALQSSGSEVISIRCTQMYSNPGQYYLFGRPIPFLEKTNNPEIVLRPGTMPGECFAFDGQQGYIVIKLSSRIKVTDFTMDHAPKEILPRGHMASAPRDFEVVGLRDLYDPEPVNLGKFRFLDNGECVQQFKAKEVDESFDIVELKILSNHGHNDYTCLYRFRVHGIPVIETSLI